MITLTRELAYAAGSDAANKQMREHGRTVWDAADYDLACDTFNNLWKFRGNLFSTGHAWRSGECKWCGKKGDRFDRSKCSG